jgi:hypothetical protein
MLNIDLIIPLLGVFAVFPLIVLGFVATASIQKYIPFSDFTENKRFYTVACFFR